MNLIQELKEHCHKRRSIRKLIRIFGVRKKEELTHALNEMTDEQVMALVLHWLVWHAEDGHKIELRMFDVEEQKVYAIGLTLMNNGIYVQGIREASELINQIMHDWNVTTTYQTLTIQETKASVTRADVLNSLVNEDALEQCVNELTSDEV